MLQTKTQVATSSKTQVSTPFKTPRIEVAAPSKQAVAPSIIKGSASNSKHNTKQKEGAREHWWGFKRNWLA